MLDRGQLNSAKRKWFSELSGPYLRYVQQEHEELLQRHQELTGGTAYIVGGAIYSVHPGQQRDLSKLKKLPDALLPAHAAWVANCNRHRHEWVQVEQVLNTALTHANSWQDIRDMIPDHVLRPFPATGLMELTRTRPDLYAGQPTDPTYSQERGEREKHWGTKLLDLYERVAPTIDLYVSYRLL